MQPKGTLDSTKVTDIEKRRSPTKHYVYVVEVKWSDGSCYSIGRKFGSFFEMHMSLLEKFPVEGGQKDPSKRIIPFLPGKNIFARNHSRDITLKRLQSITEYCEALNVLPEHISQCDILKRFFQASEDDVSRYLSNSSSDGSDPSQSIHTITGPLEFDTYLVIADYKAEDKSQIGLTAGENVDVAEKNENGWWLVCNSYGSSGWVPGAYLEKPDGKKDDLITESAERGKGSCYKATCAFEATSSDEISFPMGAVLEILQKNLEGWWLAYFNGSEGWVPGSYLVKSEVQCREVAREESDSVGSLPSFGGGGPRAVGSKPRLPPKRSTIRRQVPKGGKTQNKLAKCSYVTLYDFTATIEGGLSFQEGKDAEVLEQSDNGWWLIEIDGNKGWAPANYLKLKDHAEQPKIDIRTPERSPSPRVFPSSPSKFGPPSPGLTISSSPRRSRPSSAGAPLSSTSSSTSSLSPSSLQISPSFNFDSKTNRNGKPARPISPVFNRKSPHKHLGEGRKSLPKTPTENSQLQTVDITANWSASTEATKNSGSPTIRHRPASAEISLGALRSRVFKQTDEASLEQETWFRKISRESAERALIEENKEGYFIVRPSSRKGSENPYSLTLFNRQTIFNFHIRKRNDGLFATGVYSDGEKTFQSVPEMINFYHSNTLVVGDSSNLVTLRGSPAIV